MKCPHCGIHFHDDWAQDLLNWGQNNAMKSEVGDVTGCWSYRSTRCAGCKDFIIEVALTKNKEPIEDWRQVYPIGANR